MKENKTKNILGGGGNSNNFLYDNTSNIKSVIILLQV